MDRPPRTHLVSLQPELDARHTCHHMQPITHVCVQSGFACVLQARLTHVMGVVLHPSRMYVLTLSILVWWSI